MIARLLLSRKVTLISTFEPLRYLLGLSTSGWHVKIESGGFIIRSILFVYVGDPQERMFSFFSITLVVLVHVVCMVLWFHVEVAGGEKRWGMGIDRARRSNVCDSWFVYCSSPVFELLEISSSSGSCGMILKTLNTEGRREVLLSRW